MEKKIKITIEGKAGSGKTIALMYIDSKFKHLGCSTVVDVKANMIDINTEPFTSKVNDMLAKLIKE